MKIDINKSRIERMVSVGPFWCDFYHLTTAYTLFQDDQHDVTETFEMYVRKNPFKGAYTLTAGLGVVLDWIKNWKFTDEHINHLRQYKNKLGKQKFDEKFLDMLKTTPLELDIDALPEGEIAFPNEPFVRVTGPSWQCGLVESAFLNALNSGSLVATKASRIIRSAEIDGVPRTVMEFGLRRAPDFMGLNSSRAAIIAGIKCTSNVASSLIDGTENTGTHPHFYIMHYEDESLAFEKWLIHNKDDFTSLLVDSYDTLKGVEKAIKACKKTGVALDSIRLDSGDLAYLSREARKMLDSAGLNETKIIGSNDLDEYIIASLIQEQDAKFDSFGVGTKLVAPENESALGGVYKLKVSNGRDVIKVSDQPTKTTIPGATEVIRILENESPRKFGGDIIISIHNNLESEGILPENIESINLFDDKRRTFQKGLKYYKPIVPVVRKGKILNNTDTQPISEIADFARKNLDSLDDSHRRLVNPHFYVAGLEEKLYNERKNMILEISENNR